MFFNNCNCCRCRQYCCRQENKGCNKPENKPCFDKNEGCEKHEKECACKRPSRPCCNIGDRHLYENENGYNSKTTFGGQEYKSYSNSEYSNSFSEQNKLNRGYDYDNEFDSHKQDGYFDKQDNNTNNFNQSNNFNYGDYDRSYTPSWNEDKCCKPNYPDDKHDKCDKHDLSNKCCKPVKYICIPFDKD